MKSLLIGCGSRRKKDVKVLGDDFHNLVTLDNNRAHNPDVVHDLKRHPLPFSDNSFDEVHAYDVLEHLVYQGDHDFFFAEFSEYWRILKRGGLFVATCPEAGTPWAFGDPSHKRVITAEQLTFLSQDSYKQIGMTKMSDFRYMYKADFATSYIESKDDTFIFILEAIK